MKMRLKSHMSDSMLKKLNNTKSYYVNLWHDLKDLGQDIVNDLRQPFMLIMFFMSIASVAALVYNNKHFLFSYMSATDLLRFASCLPSETQAEGEATAWVLWH